MIGQPPPSLFPQASPPTPTPTAQAPVDYDALAKQLGGRRIDDIAKELGGRPVVKPGGPPPPVDPSTLTPLPGIAVDKLAMPDVRSFGSRALQAGKDLRAGVSRVLPAAAATAGGALGFARAGQPGDIAGSMAGEAAGTLGAVMFDQATGGPAITSPESKARLAAMPENALIAGATSAVAGPFARGLTTAGRFLFSPVKETARVARESMKPGMEAATRYVEGRVMPHEVGGQGAIKFLGNIIEGSPATAGQYRKFLDDRVGLFKQKAEEMITAPGPRATRQEAGEVIKDAKIGRAEALTGGWQAEAQARGLELQEHAGGRAHDILSSGQTEAARLRSEAEAVTLGAAQAYDRAVSESAGAWGAMDELLGPRLGREGMSTRTQQLFTAAHEAARDESSKVYNRIWAQTANDRLGVEPLIATAASLRSEAGELGTKLGVSGKAGRATGTLTAPGEEAAEEAAAATGQFISPQARKTLQETAASSDYRALSAKRVLEEIESMEAALTAGGAAASLSPQQVHRLKSLFGQAGFATEQHTFETGEFKQLYKAADKILQSLSPETYQLIKAADANHQIMVRTFEEGALASLAKKAPRDVLDLVLQNVKKGRVSTVKTLLDEIGPEGAQSVQAEVWQSLTRTPDGALRTPAQFLKEVKALDQDAVKVLFGKSADRLPALGQLLERQAAAEAARGPAEKSAATLAKRATTRESDAIDAADDLLVRAERDTAKAITTAETRGQKALEQLHKLPTENLVAASLKNADAKGAEALRALVGEDGWKKVQSVDLQTLFGRVEGDAGAPLLTPKALTDRLNARGEEAFTRTHSQGEWNQLHAFARAWEKLARGEPGSTGKMMIQLRTPAAAAGVAGTAALYLSGNDLSTTATTGLVTGGAVLLGPKVLAKIFMHPRMRQELMKGMSAKIRRDQPLVVRASTNLLRMLATEGIVAEGGAPGSGQLRDPAQGGRGAGAGPVGAASGTGGRAGGPPPLLTPAGSAGPSGGAVRPAGPPAVRLLDTLGQVRDQAVGTPPPPIRR